MIRDNFGDAVGAGYQKGVGFGGPELEEGRACLLALQYARDHGFHHLEVEGDCLTLIQKLKSKKVEASFVGFIVVDILTLALSFEFISWGFVKRKGNKVAHALAHFDPFSSLVTTWSVDLPESIIDLVNNDMYAFLNSRLI